ncbi:MAG: hypothetical protein H6728_08020 [Myxococcales bacterium]|nr:hypothetical protein [Myxococcales bacterium]MCB9643004.1 hypothetical protein [Myxococcales bacterium]
MQRFSKENGRLSTQPKRNRWFFRGIALLMLWGISFVGGCTDPKKPSVCGDCAEDERCDTRTKKCIPLLCSPCQQSVECNNNEFCNDKGCCQQYEEGQRPEPIVPEKQEISIEPISEPSSEGNIELLPDGVQPEDAGENIPEPISEPTCANPPCVCPATPCPADKCCNSQGACVECGNRLPCQACQDDAECGQGNRCFPVGGKSLCVLGCPDDMCPQNFQCLDLGAGSGKLCIPNGECTAQPLCTGVTCSGTDKCCEDTGRCQPCCESADCAVGSICKKQGNKNICETTPNGCPQACANNEVCDQQKRQCVEDCRSAGCKNPNEQCDGITGLCNRKDCRSNFNCTAPDTCNPSTGNCDPPPPDCRQAGSTPCAAPSCCNQTNGKCETGCQACGCPTGQTCDAVTKACKVAVCKRPNSCSSSSQCCGSSCVSTGVLGLGTKRCRCTSNSQCQSGNCELDFFSLEDVCK